MNFDGELKRYTTAVEDALKKYLSADEKNIVTEAMQYSVMNGGKRLRPIILLASAEAFGGSQEDALPFAAAIEMIHTYSLVHDDLPAMDDDDYRRGKLSCHKKYGEAYAILAGDALLNRAYETILSALLLRGAKKAESYLSAAGVIAGAAGINGLISGQTFDISNQHTGVDETTLIYINERKTGALISAAFEAGAIIGGANERDAGTFAEAGMKMGIAFQIRDDILDVDGSVETTGKLSGNDSKNNKTTYVTILGKQKCAERICGLTEEAVNLLNLSGVEVNFLTTLIAKLTNRNK